MNAPTLCEWDVRRVALPTFQNAIEDARKYRHLPAVRQHSIETAKAAARLIRATTPYNAGATLRTFAKDAIRNTPCKR
jgi:hypothetical protein